MAKKIHALLWRLPEDTANETSQIRRSDEISAWLDEQSMPRVAYAKDLAIALYFLEQELSARGLSLKTH